jgi:hypothetical protein
MRYFSLPLLLWVVLPTGVGLVAAGTLQRREAELQRQDSTLRMGGLAVHLFSEEMGRRAAGLVLEAPPLTNPSSSSPLLQAAQLGDTVAALGRDSGGLTLSVALLEDGDNGLQLRATADEFQPGSLDLLGSRTGFGTALFLRGKKATSSPPGFGPDELPSVTSPSPGSSPGWPPGSALFSLSSHEGGATPAQLLVGPIRGEARPRALWPLGAFLVLAMGLGFLAHLFPPTTRNGEGPAAPRFLILNGVPLLLLWGLLFQAGASVSRGARDSLQEDMVRVMALIREEPAVLTLEAVEEATGFDVLRGRNGEVVESTLSPGPLTDEFLALPLPPPTFPTLGERTVDGERVVYGQLREEGGGHLILLAPSPDSRTGRFTLLLTMLGGGISLFSLGYPLQLRRRGRVWGAGE